MTPLQLTNLNTLESEFANPRFGFKSEVDAVMTFIYL